MMKASICSASPASAPGDSSVMNSGGKRVSGAAVLVLILGAALACANTASVPPATVKPLMTRDLVGLSGKEISMITVEYVPGGASRPHRHDAQVFVYVLEGAMTMQVSGGRAGDDSPRGDLLRGPG